MCVLSQQLGAIEGWVVFSSQIQNLFQSEPTSSSSQEVSANTGSAASHVKTHRCLGDLRFEL